jgi:hypothetical protein
MCLKNVKGDSNQESSSQEKSMVGRIRGSIRAEGIRSWTYWWWEKEVMTPRLPSSARLRSNVKLLGC